jgi:hypothetical protein
MGANDTDILMHTRHGAVLVSVNERNAEVSR